MNSFTHSQAVTNCDSFDYVTSSCSPFGHIIMKQINKKWRISLEKYLPTSILLTYKLHH